MKKRTSMGLCVMPIIDKQIRELLVEAPALRQHH
jgi:hypothetical protein